MTTTAVSRELALRVGLADFDLPDVSPGHLLTEQSLLALRASHSDIQFTHCMKFTSEIGHATGLMLAEVVEDEN